MPYLLRSVFSLLILGLTPLIALNLGWNAPRRADSLSIPRRTSSKPWFRPARRIERDLAPLSSAQKGVWAVTQTDPLGRVFHRPIAVRLDGPLNRAALEASLNRLVQRHEALRTVFVVDDGEPQQWVRDDIDEIALDVLDLRHMPTDLQEVQVRRIAWCEAESPFDVAARPLLRAKLLRLSEQ